MFEWQVVSVYFKFFVTTSTFSECSHIICFVLKHSGDIQSYLDFILELIGHEIHQTS